jgi:hypothetical protein
MVEAELVLGRLRNQVRELQKLLNYLESCEVMRTEEYAYLDARLREVIGELTQTHRFSSRYGGRTHLQAQWVN